MSKISFLYKKFLFNFKPRKNLDTTDLKIVDLDDLFNYFASDKGSNIANPYKKKVTKGLGHGFAKFYKKHLEDFRKREINFLEIGTWKGGSVAAFYFYLKKDFNEKTKWVRFLFYIKNFYLILNLEKT